MNIILKTILLLLFFAGNIYAAEVPIKMVTKVALNAYFLNSGVKVTTEDIVEITPVKEGEENIFYIINFNTGYVIVSANDIAEPVLGLGIESNLSFKDKSKVPPNLLCLLGNMKEEILYAIKQKALASPDVTERWEYYLDSNNKTYTVGQYLIGTTWGQGQGFQQLCPFVPGSTTFRCVVGCGGVAAAQILKYWDYDVIPQGAISYTPTGFSSPITIDFSQQNYLWLRMNSSSPNEHNALLLYHAAAALKSQFNQGLTSSYIANAKSAFYNYFSLNANLKSKNSYTSTQWVALLKDNIDDSNPIYYRGQGSSGGHAWVVDGYNSNDLFHCNWGWYGSENDWFALNNLTTSNGVFNDLQQAIIDIYPKDCRERIISNTTISSNVSYHNCGIKVENTTIQNSASVTLEADKQTQIIGPFEVKIGSTLYVK